MRDEDLSFHWRKFKVAPTRLERDRHFDKIQVLVRPTLDALCAPHVRRRGRDACLSVALSGLLEAVETWDEGKGRALRSYITYIIQFRLWDAFSPKVAKQADLHERGLTTDIEPAEITFPGSFLDAKSETAYRRTDDTDALEDVLRSILGALAVQRYGEGGLTERDQAVLLEYVFAADEPTHAGIAEALRCKHPSITAKKVDNILVKIRSYLRAFPEHLVDEIMELLLSPS
jgi:DNA-directed RNA polymerase sigma subunit (sigma70/sigma32)